MGRTSTFTAVAEDCRAFTGEVPRRRAGAPTAASTQSALLTARPGHWTQEDVLVRSCPAVRGREHVDEDELTRVREELFARPRACLRASPLPKTYGWGLHDDERGRITLHAVDSPEYARLSQDGGLAQLPGHEVVPGPCMSPEPARHALTSPSALPSSTLGGQGGRGR